jgi:hypothetical protein
MDCMSRTGSSRVFVVCAACGRDDAWEGSEKVWRVDGQEGSIPEEVLIYGCECGNQQAA